MRSVYSRNPGEGHCILKATGEVKGDLTEEAAFELRLVNEWKFPGCQRSGGRYVRVGCTLRR